MITAETELRKLAATPFQIRRAYVVQHQGAISEMPPGQGALGAVLLAAKPGAQGMCEAEGMAKPLSYAESATSSLDQQPGCFVAFEAAWPVAFHAVPVISCRAWTRFCALAFL